MSKLISAANLTVDQAELVRPDRVHTSLYTDPAPFETELDKIFHSTWIWVADESEVTDAGSCRTTYFGKQPVIVVRDCKKGKTDSFVRSFGTPDDSDAWEQVQKGANVGENLWIMLNRGLPGEKPTPDGLISHVSAETGMGAAYQQWKKMMNEEAK